MARKGTARRLKILNTLLYVSKELELAPTSSLLDHSCRLWLGHTRCKGTVIVSLMKSKILSCDKGKEKDSRVVMRRCDSIKNFPGRATHCHVNFIILLHLPQQHLLE